MNRSGMAPATLLISTFVLGALLGGAATTLVDRRAHQKPHPERERPSFVQRLGHDLDLSDPQRDSVQIVLDRHQPAMDSLWRQMGPLFEAERLKIRAEINALLTPEQRAKYAALVQRQDSLRRAGQDRNRNGRP